MTKKCLVCKRIRTMACLPSKSTHTLKRFYEFVITRRRVFPFPINEKLIDFCKGNFMCSIYITYRKLAAVTYFQSAMLAVRRGQSLANETPLTLCREKLYRHLFTADFWLMNEGGNSNPLHKYLQYVCKAEGKNLNTWFELNEQQSCRAAPHHQRTPFI